ncbi:hypothetical protein AAFX60_018720 [Aliivibrio fischeri]
MMIKNKAPTILKHFNFQYLPDHLKKVSQPFSDVANNVVLLLPDNEEREIALRKLLEAKDCAVRAILG